MVDARQKVGFSKAIVHTIIVTIHVLITENTIQSFVSASFNVKHGVYMFRESYTRFSICPEKRISCFAEWYHKHEAGCFNFELISPETKSTR